MVIKRIIKLAIYQFQEEINNHISTPTKHNQYHKRMFPAFSQVSYFSECFMLVSSYGNNKWFMVYDLTKIRTCL